ncbi:hypothetical protein H2201_000631 [Coniosporium apollinis]|uniref:CSC1/OSCA1-like 7TM region domain-containing protein n=1 Tax=Coniosporium apollinis TaxID=61459 RepID=A0ABQ9P3W5_9PEZI|nr:hypothetical protein H2201_000631 [Coniosporium apollinis]
MAHESQGRSGFFNIVRLELFLPLVNHVLRNPNLTSITSDASSKVSKTQDRIIRLVGLHLLLYTLILSVTFLIHAGVFGQAVKAIFIKEATKSISDGPLLRLPPALAKLAQFPTANFSILLFCPCVMGHIIITEAQLPGPYMELAKPLATALLYASYGVLIVCTILLRPVITWVHFLVICGMSAWLLWVKCVWDVERFDLEEMERDELEDMEQYELWDMERYDQDLDEVVITGIPPPIYRRRFGNGYFIRPLGPDNKALRWEVMLMLRDVLSRSARKR